VAHFKCGDLQVFGGARFLLMRQFLRIDVSGGRWKDVAGKPYRFDGHNGAVPQEIYPLLHAALARCPNTELVTFERRVNSLDTESEITQMQADYRQLYEAVKSADQQKTASAAPLDSTPVVPFDAISTEQELADYEDALVDVLSMHAPPETLRAELLARPVVAAVQDYVASIRLRNLQATSLLLRRWARTEAEMDEAGLIPKTA
jgi:hypothetical protein